MNEKLTFKRSLSWIILSTLLISGTSWTGWLLYTHTYKRWMQDPSYAIVALIQSSEDQDALPTLFLAELLELSKDRPTNLYAFDTQEARRKLAACSFIKRADVKKIKPGTIFVDYALRKPIAYLKELSNTAVDEEGQIFTFAPFFTPKNMPELVMGQDVLKWGAVIEGPKWEAVKSIKEEFSRLFDSQQMRLQRIDVSRSEAKSYGQREVIVVLEDIKSKELTTLRLHSKEYLKGLANYQLLNDHLKDKAKPKIVNLRNPDCAFMLGGG